MESDSSIGALEKMNEKVSVKASILRSTQEEKDLDILKLHIEHPWANILREWLKNHRKNVLRVYFEEFNDNPSERALNLYHLLIDRLVLHSEGHSSKKYHEQIHNAMKSQYGPRKENGEIKGQSEGWTTAETWNMIQAVEKECVEQGIDVSDLNPDIQDLRRSCAK